MRTENKIKAFTLTEMLVVIVISAIVVGVALSVLNLVQQNFYSIRQNYEEATRIQLSKQQMLVDFNRYHEIVVNREKKNILFKNSMDSIQYSYNENLLLRHRDTISYNIKNMEFYFNGEEVSTGKIDAIKLLFESPTTTEIFIFKTNDAKSYLTNNGN